MHIWNIKSFYGYCKDLNLFDRFKYNFDRNLTFLKISKIRYMKGGNVYTVIPPNS